MKTGPVGFQALLDRMPRWFAEHARKTEWRGRRRRAAQAVRFELAFTRPASSASPAGSLPPAWSDTVLLGPSH